ncbi:hypothetical protein J5751_00455 [bacterium]|nr:hypothetical protein [bacterium]
MKELCNRIMKLSTDLPFGIDYTPIVLAIFLKEHHYDNSINYLIEDFTNYVFRFYCDLAFPREHHYVKKINKIFHYQPIDFVDYCTGILQYVSEHTGLIYLTNTSFSICDCYNKKDLDSKLLDNIVKILVTKYINSDCSNYNSEISDSDLALNKYDFGTRIFNRALELNNRCFICDETNFHNLEAVELSHCKGYQTYNYLLLCHNHAEEYKGNQLIIRKNGYAYYADKRLFQHLEIGILKKIRVFLPE